MHTRKYSIQPQHATPIDYAGLAKGVRILWNPAAGPIDLVTGRIWIPGGNAAIATTHRGRAFSLDGVDDYYSHTGYPEITGNTGTFFMWCPTVGSSDDFGHVLFANSDPSPINWYQVHSSSTLYLMGVEGTGTVSWFNTTNRSIVFSSGGTAATMGAYLDGKNSGVVWSSAPTSWASGNKNLALGRYPAGNAQDFSGSILIAGYTSAVWGEAESRAFHENPWQLFKMSSRRSQSIISIGGSSYTISPSGSLVLSGSASHIKTKIFLPTGDINFSGNSRLIKEKIISPQGTISLSGNNPVIKTKIVNASGTISFTGTTPVIRSKIIESSGGINFSGTASLSGAVSYILTPIGGLTFNGSSSLIKTHIQIPTGRISFSGSAPMESNTVIITISTRLPLTGVGK